MVEMIDSFLTHRLEELKAGHQEVPLVYDELRTLASEHLPKGTYDYAAGGAGTEDTVIANRTAFRDYRIVPSVLQDVSDLDLTIELFDVEASAPIILAPIGGQMNYHEGGELEAARAAESLGVPIALSTHSSFSIEDVAEANEDGSKFFQLYWPNSWEVAESFVDRAETAGYDGIILTVDSKIPKWRLRNFRNDSSPSIDMPKAIFESDKVVRELAESTDEQLKKFVRNSNKLKDDPSIDWDDLDTLREWTDLPIILKGILSAEDAKRAVDWGAEGIIVSNHGGRQIDGEVTALKQLPIVADAVGGATTIIFDSGVRTGVDTFVALALGADAVQIGRPYVFGLAIAGQRGVWEVIMNVLAELESIIGLSGRSSVDEIDSEAVIQV